MNIPKEHVLNNNENAYCFGLFERISNCPEIREYYGDVFMYIIQPIFKRFGYYSPTMAMSLFFGLLCLMGEFYCNSHYGLVWKHFVRDSYPRHKIVMSMKQFLEDDKVMVRDELNTWKSIKKAPMVHN